MKVEKLNIEGKKNTIDVSDKLVDAKINIRKYGFRQILSTSVK